MKKPIDITTIIIRIFGIAVWIIAIGQFGDISEVNAQTLATIQDESPQSQETVNVMKQLNNTFIAIAEKANPSVVTIFTDKIVNQPDPYSSPFGDFFGRVFPEREQHLQGMGSGVIISKDGFILTNNHVVRDADAIKIRLLNGIKLEAKIIGTDAKTDIAVLKVKGKNLAPMTLGDSDHLHTGEWVMAIGSPLSENLAHTVTAGIVSAKGRSNVGLADYEDFIQTDAAINPGNSGGALVNLDGKLVGINTAIASQSGGFQGIGFAVPINMARRIMESLIEEGRVVRGWLGVLIQDIDENLAKALNVPVSSGVLVADITKNSPAEKSGINPGDIILELDGLKVQDGTQLRNEIARRAPGTGVKMVISRNGKQNDLNVILGELPGEPVKPARKEDVFEKLGFKVQPVDEQIAKILRIDPNEKGLVVMEILPNSPVFESGLRPGDLIREVNRVPVNTVNDFIEIVARLNSEDTVLVHLKRYDNHFFAAFALP